MFLASSAFPGIFLVLYGMKTLIVHPQDSTTTFLQGLYIDLPDKTVITGGITKAGLNNEIQTHARVILCGHGSSQGLLSVGQFPDSGLYIIDELMVSSLRNKANTLYIWCNADVFIRRHRLSGFHTGMFLSQMSECSYFGVHCTEEDIIESNTVFTETVSHHLKEPSIVFYRNVLIEYGRLARKKPVARYNGIRLYLNHYEPHLFYGMVGKLL